MAKRKPRTGDQAAHPPRPWLTDGKGPVLPRQPWRRPNATAGLHLRDALFHYGPESLAESVWRIELCGFHEPYMLVGDDGWPIDPAELSEHRLAHFRWERQRRELEAALVDRLRSGDVYATGFSPLAPIDQPAARIAADRWRVLRPDFARSQATGPGGPIEGILVFPGGGEESCTGSQGRYSRTALHDWYRGRVAELVAAGLEPSRDEDWEAAKAEFGPKVTREVVRALRRELAPASWRRFGRRKREP